MMNNKYSALIIFLSLILAVTSAVTGCRPIGNDLSDNTEELYAEVLSSGSSSVPKLSVRWSSATKLYDLPSSGFSGDYTVFKDNSGRFHIIGMDHASGNDRDFFEAGGNISGKMTFETRISVSGNPLNVWSPFVIYNKSKSSYYLFYHYQTEFGSSQIRIMESKDASLKKWTPLNNSSLKEGCIAFEGDSARDPYVLYDSSIGKYLMYYSGNGIMLRTSTDLITWSEPISVLKSVDSFKYVDSPCVIIKNGKYYLFAGSSDFGRTAVYCSDRYNRFSSSDFLGEINGHGVKIYTDGSTDYIFGSQINNWSGTDVYSRNSKGKYNLPGIYVQKLQWVSSSGADWLRMADSDAFDDNALQFITDKADYHWTFDGNVSEEHGLGKKITPDASCFTTGLDGQCLICDNSFYNTLIYDLQLGTEFTISFYMKMSDTRGQWNILFSKGPKAEGHLEVYVSPDGSLSFYQQELCIEDMHVKMTDNRWHHCAFTYDGNVLKCYVDGANVASISKQGVPKDDPAHPLAIGALYEYDTPIFFYNGLIDDLKIFNRVIDSVSYN